MQVIFENIKRKYNQSKDICLNIILSDGTLFENGDNIVLFQVSFDNKDFPVCRGYITDHVIDKAKSSTKISATFFADELAEINYDEVDFFQVCYLRKNGTMLGKSWTFQFSSDYTEDIIGSELPVRSNEAQNIDKNGLIKFEQDTFQSQIMDYKTVLYFLIDQLSSRSDSRELINPDSKFFSDSKEDMLMYVQDLFSKLDQAHHESLVQENRKIEDSLNKKFTLLSEQIHSKLIEEIQPFIKNSEDLIEISKSTKSFEDKIETMVSENKYKFEDLVSRIEEKLENMSVKIDQYSENMGKLSKIIKGIDDLSDKVDDVKSLIEKDKLNGYSSDEEDDQYEIDFE